MIKTKLVLILSFAISALCFSQVEDNLPFEFNTRYYDAVDKWVAFPESEKDSSHMLCYIYVDKMAGFSLRVEDNFKVDLNGKLVVLPNETKETTALIMRLDSRTSPVAILNDEQIKTLKLPKSPKWASIYKDGNSVDYLQRLGYHYNHVGASTNAIAPLLKAYAMDPHYDGLEFELGFAYNATKQFLKAIPVLEKAIELERKSHYLYKELGYAYVNSNQLDKAEKIYEKGIKISKDNAIKCEMGVNMAQAFFKTKNKAKFEKWAKITRRYGDKTPQYLKYIAYFEEELKKN